MHANLTLAYSFGPHPLQTSIISSHVDNLGLYCSSKVEVKLLKSQIRKHVSIKDLGEIQSILGIEVIRDWQARTISLSHHCYIDEIVNRLWSIRSKGCLLTYRNGYLPHSGSMPINTRRDYLHCTPSHTRLLLDCSIMQQWWHAQTSPKQSKLLRSSLLILESITGMQLSASFAISGPHVTWFWL